MVGGGRWSGADMWREVLLEAFRGLCEVDGVEGGHDDDDDDDGDGEEGVRRSYGLEVVMRVEVEDQDTNDMVVMAYGNLRVETSVAVHKMLVLERSLLMKNKWRRWMAVDTGYGMGRRLAAWNTGTAVMAHVGEGEDNVMMAVQVQLLEDREDKLEEALDGILVVHLLGRQERSVASGDLVDLVAWRKGRGLVSPSASPWKKETYVLL